MPRKRTETVNFTLRMREDLRRRLAQIAKKEDRSLNEEIVRRLEQSFSTEDVVQAVEDGYRKMRDEARSELEKLRAEAERAAIAKAEAELNADLAAVAAAVRRGGGKK